MSENTDTTGDEGQERHDVTITYANGSKDLFPDVDGDAARELENAAFVLPGVVVVKAQVKR